MVVPTGPRRPARRLRVGTARGGGVSIVVWLGLAAFVGLGLPEATLGVTWPSIRVEFGRPLSAVGLLLGALTVGYLPASALSGRIVARVGAGSMLVAASAVYATAMAVYLTAPSLPFLVVGSLLGGIAAGLIDPGINAHFALHYGTRTMNLLHASFGIGATAGPFIATLVVGAGGSWRVPYAMFLVVQAALVAGFALTRPRWSALPVRHAAPDRGRPEPLEPRGAAPPGDHPSVIGLSILTFFLYTGLEVGAGVLAFTLLTESRGLSDTSAGLWTTAFWAGLTLGRVALGVVGGGLHPEQIMRTGTLAAVASTALIAVDPAGWGAAGFPLLGLALSGIFPSLVLLTPRRVGADRTSNLMGVQFSIAAIGATGVPAAISLLAEGHLERIGVALFVLAVSIAALDLVITRVSRPRSVSAIGQPGGEVAGDGEGVGLG